MLALRRLTVVKIIMWLGRLLGRLLAGLGRVLLAIPRFVGWFFLDIAYGLKGQQIESDSATQPRRSLFFSFVSYLVSLILLIPRSIYRFFTRLERVGTEENFKPAQRFSEVKKIEATYHPPVAWSLVNFCLTLLIIISPIVIYGNWRWLESVKTKVFGSSQNAVEQLLSAQNLLAERKPAEAQLAFSAAGQNFLQAREDLSAVNSWLLDIASVIPNDSARLAAAGRHFIRAGELSSELGQTLTSALVLPEGAKPTAGTILDHFVVTAEPALPIARQLEAELKKVNVGDVPSEYQAQVADLSTKVHFLVSSLEEAITLGKQASTFLGQEMDKRYMLVFQNNTEKRGPGGFIGSFAIVDVRRGEITKLTVPKGGTYDTEAGLTKIVAAPEPLRLLNPRWHFWDANWWPHWPTSARKLMWFYEHSDGPTVDGVISLTPTVIERVLEIIGPIDMMADYGVAIDANNFWSVTQTFSEQKPDVTTEPKKIIGDLMNRLIEELPQRLTPEKTVALIGVLEQALAEKLILAYVSDEELEATISRFNWAGEIKQTAGDYLMVVNTNIGGQKSDKVISETLTHDARILPDGSIIDTLTIRREHHGLRGQPFVGVRNNNWLRVYVPEGSRLLKASGFQAPEASLFEIPDPKAEIDPDVAVEDRAEIDYSTGTKIYNETGKTVFANWTTIDPGETDVITFEYELPFRLAPPVPRTGLSGLLDHWIGRQPSSAYTLLVQKQPGALDTTLHSLLTIEAPVTVAWTYPTDNTLTRGWQQVRPLTTDFFGATLFTYPYAKN